MELAGEYVVFLDGRVDPGSVPGGGGDDISVCRVHVIGMDKVDKAALRHVFKKPALYGVCQVVPADLGHFPAFPVGDAQDTAGQDPQAFHAGTFLAGFKQQLLAQADAQERGSLVRHMMDDLLQVELTDPGHGVSEGADTGQDDPVRPGYDIPVSGQDRFPAQIFHGVVNAFDIAGFIINDCDHIFIPRFQECLIHPDAGPRRRYPARTRI